VKASIWGALPIVSAADRFSTDNASNVETASKPQFFDDSTTMRVALMKGFTQSGKTMPPPPADHPEWANGDITISNTSDLTAFDQWWVKAMKQDGRNPDEIDRQMRESFDDGTK
jgi:hypothetical protein